MLSYHNITTEKYRYISFHLKSNTGKLFADSHTLVALPCLFTLYHQPLSNIVIQQCVEQVKAPNSDQTYLIDTKADEVMETKAILRNLKVLYSRLFKKKTSSLPCFRNCYFRGSYSRKLILFIVFPLGDRTCPYISNKATLQIAAVNYPIYDLVQTEVDTLK